MGNYQEVNDSKVFQNPCGGETAIQSVNFSSSHINASAEVQDKHASLCQHLTLLFPNPTENEREREPEESF